MMVPEYSKNTNIGVGFGIALHVIAFILKFLPFIGLLSGPLYFIGTLFFIWGGINYARAKGYPGIIGFLCLFSILGFVVLVLLPDRSA
jgi:hypothetical protein